ncbi:MAG: hypothetical protein IT319_08705 [Anaerolineae bacterium]|nr:hypothetical protein [Anaerolineae bacterium]
MEKRKYGISWLRSTTPVAWFLPLHLEFDVAAPVSECLQRLSTNFNVKNKDHFKYEAAANEKVAFTITRQYERTSLGCDGTLQQVNESRTHFRANLGSEGPLVQVIFGVLLTLFCIAAQVEFLPLIIWISILYLARRNYQTQSELADDLEHVFLQRWR